MQCPICGSDRKAEFKKCPTCGVVFADWLNKVIKRLNKKTDKVMARARTPKKGDDNDSFDQYKEVIKQD